MSDRLASLADEAARLGHGFSGRYSLGVHDFVRGEHRLVGPDDWFPTASTIKLPIHSALAEGIAQGRIDPDELVTAQLADWVSGSGVLKDLELPVTVRLGDAATLMIIVSDNVATNLVIERLGVDAVNDFFGRMGFGDGLRLIRPIVDVEEGVDLFAQARPSTFLDYLVALHDGVVPNHEYTLAAARRQHYRDQMARHLPMDPYLPGSLVVANKTGSDRGVRVDVGLVAGEGRDFAFVMMTEGSSDQGFRHDHEGERLIGDVCRRAYDLLG